MTSFVLGNCVWTDDNGIYYSNGFKQCVLNKETNTWEINTWNGTNNLVGNCVWTDGTNIYYSNGNTYVLNKR